MWQGLLDTFYDVTQLDETTMARLHQEFVDASLPLLTNEQRLPCGLRINLATTRLTALPGRP